MAKRKSSARFSFVNRDDPNYRPSYGTTYSQKQMDILYGVIPLDNVRINELTVLMKKAEQMGDIDSYEQAKELYCRKLDPGIYFPKYTIEEAKAILQSLTPWIIDWGDEDD